MPVALVVDGDPSSARRIDEWLRGAGWTVVLAASAPEALTYATRLKEQLTLVVLSVGPQSDTLYRFGAEIAVAHPDVGILVLGAEGSLPVRLGSQSESMSASSSGEMLRPVSVRSAHLSRPFTEDQLLAAARGQIPTGRHFAVLQGPDDDLR